MDLDVELKKMRDRLDAVEADFTAYRARVEPFLGRVDALMGWRREMTGPSKASEKAD